MNFTLDFDKLKKDWMRIYMNLMIMKSTDPKIMALLESFSLNLAEMNQDMMQFFERMEYL